jgi:hypothetical protein
MTDNQEITLAPSEDGQVRTEILTAEVQLEQMQGLLRDALVRASG